MHSAHARCAIPRGELTDRERATDATARTHTHTHTHTQAPNSELNMGHRLVNITRFFVVHEGSTVEIPASDGRCAENQARSSSTTESRFRRKMAPAVRTYCLFVRAPPAIMPYSSVTVPCKITLNPGRDTREQATKRTHERRHESTHERRHTHQRKRPTVYMHGLGPSMWGCEWSHWTNRTTRSRSSRSGGVRTACSLQLYCTLLPDDACTPRAAAAPPPGAAAWL